MRPTVVLELDACARDLALGGAFAPGCALPLASECELIVRGGTEELRLDARVVFADGNGAGLEIVGFDAALKAKLEALDAAPERERPLHMHERLRNLSVSEQVKRAHSHDPQERMLLERMYGKTVWETLLRNPRITPPEVARIARMGQLPRPLIEIIVGHGAWLQLPEVRRALLSNPRLGNDQVLRVLRQLSRQELKLCPMQSSYPRAVRDWARRMLDGTVT